MNSTNSNFISLKFVYNHSVYINIKACFCSITYDVVTIPIYTHYYVTSKSSLYLIEIFYKMLCYDWLTQNTEF